MEQRDLIKNQIELLGKVLGQILAEFLGTKSKGQASQGIEDSIQRLQGELDLDIEKLTSLMEKDLRDYLKGRKMTAEHLEILSEYLKEIGIEEIESNKYRSKILLKKAIELLDIADEFSETLSFDRVNKKSSIEDILQQRL